MAGEDNGEKTEEATQARRDEFRKRGQVAQTRELATVMYLFFGALGIWALSRFFMQNLMDVFNMAMGKDLVTFVRTEDLNSALLFAFEKMAKIMAPVLGIILILGVGSSAIQIGFLQVEDALTLDLEKINPLTGFKRIFSLRAIVEGLKAFLKLTFIATVVYFLIKGQIQKVPYLMTSSMEQIMTYLGQTTTYMFGGVGIAMAILATGDYFFQRWDLENQMRMTKQEVKDENKSREGDPLIKARVRRIQRDIANRRMMEKVKKADVIITNPTHIAVALIYTEKLPAPQLVAKGADAMAEKIKAVAREHHVPIVENKPLARTIWKTIKIGQVIPRELFTAVAEVLSYVYKLKRKGKS